MLATNFGGIHYLLNFEGLPQKNVISNLKLIGNFYVPPFCNFHFKTTFISLFHETFTLRHGTH